MTKRVHPIKRIAWKVLYRTDHSQPEIERVIARDVKPLLDELDDAHNGRHIDALFCPACKLLAAWRAKR
jgi:hypothetical protein